jgi:nucleoside-diphosphate-sugar epimerase
MEARKSWQDILQKLYTVSVLLIKLLFYFLKLMNILIIGCGYVGSAVASFWHKQGHHLTVTTTSPEKISTLKTIANRAIILKGNDYDTLANVIENQDLILLTVGAKGGKFYEQIYLQTAKNIAKILQFNSRVKQLIYTSSYGILGNQNGRWTDETVPPNPAHENHQILAETEQIFLNCQNPNLKVCILRLAGIYGKNREIITIFKNWAGTTRPGNGQEYGHWVHLEDIVRAIALIETKQLQGIYNLGNDTPMKRKDLLDKMCQKYGLDKITWDLDPQGIMATNLRLSNQKIKDAGFIFLHPKTEI